MAGVNSAHLPPAVVYLAIVALITCPVAAIGLGNGYTMMFAAEPVPVTFHRAIAQQQNGLGQHGKGNTPK